MPLTTWPTPESQICRWYLFPFQGYITTHLDERTNKSRIKFSKYNLRSLCTVVGRWSVLSRPLFPATQSCHCSPLKSMSIVWSWALLLLHFTLLVKKDQHFFFFFFWCLTPFFKMLTNFECHIFTLTCLGLLLRDPKHLQPQFSRLGHTEKQVCIDLLGNQALVAKTQHEQFLSFPLSQT